MLNLLFLLQGRKGDHTIEHFQFKHWSRDYKIPKDPGSVQNLVEEVTAVADKGPIVVHCL